MRYFRKKLMGATPTDSRPSASRRMLVPSSMVSELSTASRGSPDPLNAVLDEPGTSEESAWTIAYGAARMAVDIVKDSSDLFPPLKAVVVALSVLIKNHDQTVANAESIRDVEERVQSLSRALTSPISDRDDEETMRRETLRKKLNEIIMKLRPLSDQHGLKKFLRNVNHANMLNGFVQDLASAVTDYHTSILQSIHENVKRIDGNTNRVTETTNKMDEIANRMENTANRTDEVANRIDRVTNGIDERTQNIIEATDLEILGKLDPVYNAGFQAGHHDTCLRGTRESVLGEIMGWASNPHERHVFWLNGLAGTGKSTIAQTFSEMVANAGTLGASFFCSRDYLDRKELKNIFPTLAYQLAFRYPAFRSHIIEVIKQDPSVGRNALISQLKDLIVGPLSSTGLSCVIVVDALDECVDDQPASAILSVLGRYAKQLPSVKFFITGRPEPRIRTGFRLPLLEPLTQVFLLHEVKLSCVDEDIRLYLREKLTAVAKRRSDIDLSNPWPCGKDLTALTRKSSGLFIFAATLARFIESEYHDPSERLRLIVTPLDNTAHEGRAGIDPLYLQVFTLAFSGIKDNSVFVNLRRVLGVAILAFNPLSRLQIAEILGIDPYLITTTFRHLHSVLLVPKEDFKEIRVFHKSFPDFLQDRDRCPDPKFFIDSVVHHGNIALDCLEMLKKLKPNPCNLPDFVMNQDVPNLPELLVDKVGEGTRYACGYWAIHVQSSPTTNDYAHRLIASATQFFMGNAIAWVEIMSLENKLESVIHNIHALFDWLMMINFPASNLRNLAEDCLRFTMHFFHLIQKSALHIYHSALPLSPSSFKNPTAEFQKKTLIAQFGGRPGKWGAVIRTIKPGSGRFTCMTTFGHRIAAACDDGTVAIHDSVTGVLRSSLYPEEPVEAMAGSPDGHMLFCTHQTPSITLWDIQTGGLVHTLTFERSVEDIAVSLKSRYAACALSDGSVVVWEASSEQGATAEIDSPVVRLCWLEPEEWLAVAGEASVYIWDVALGEVLHRFEMQDPVCGAVYSEKFDIFAVLANSEVQSTVVIVDAQTGSVSPSRGALKRFSKSSIAFSRTVKELICGLSTRGLRLFNVSTRVWKFSEYPDTINFLSSLPNGTMVANVPGLGIQLLSLKDQESAPSRQPLSIPVLIIHAFDGARVIAIVPNDSNRIVLVRPNASDHLVTIHPRNGHTIPNHRTHILCASYGHKVAAYCFEDGGKELLQLWEFGHENPRWTAEIGGIPSAGSISPSGEWLVTSHGVGDDISIRVWRTSDGKLRLRKELRLRVDQSFSIHPLQIKFQKGRLSPSDEISHYVDFLDGHRVCLIPSFTDLTGHPCRRWYDVSDNREWVLRGSERVCWIPPGYIRSVEPGYCWDRSTLVMIGQDGTLRELTFAEPF